ncbi:hypothetical protein CNR27_01750 [Luteimonas chenhongjianii]|uniref:Uncharacterized protein n=1 Tax=Luteimonas chenhongjianii TaxID=2006110 RepID=A0A290XBL1_9GAMM|nr:hypothetical protein [Luteimonas chenhongjianii]ATD66326.1 hypothetical protein CNR27_01750 [Luteimonas chenhongjianii]
MNAVPSAQSLRDAADRMVSTLAAHADPEYRLAVLKRLVRRLGEDRYPVFLRLLGVVAESDDARAQRLLADTIGTALRRMDLPGGALSSWGATQLPDSGAPLSASALSGQFFGGTPRRLLGPVEYLTVWHLQRTQRTALSAETFRTSLSRMIALLNQSEDARTLYPQKLAVDAQNELEGAYTRATRERLAAIASAWKAGRSPDEIAQAALDARAADAPHGWVLRDL